jgi:hypothetical protein
MTRIKKRTFANILKTYPDAMTRVARLEHRGGCNVCYYSVEVGDRHKDVAAIELHDEVPEDDDRPMVRYFAPKYVLNQIP